MISSVLFVSTFPDSHFELYGKDFLRSFSIHCSADLVCFVDGVKNWQKYSGFSENIKVLPYESCITERELFLANVAVDEDQSQLGILGDISKQIIRWSFKGFAQLHAYYKLSEDYQYLIYMDADTIILQKLGEKFMSKVMPKMELISVIDRQDIGKFTESGFIIWNLSNPKAQEWFERYDNYWNSHLYVSLREWHDCEIMDAIRDDMCLKLPGDIYNLGGGGLHAFESGVLGEYIDHKKGYRKYLGFSYERFIRNRVSRAFADELYKYSTKTIKAIARIAGSKRRRR